MTCHHDWRLDDDLTFATCSDCGVRVSTTQLVAVLEGLTTREEMKDLMLLLMNLLLEHGAHTAAVEGCVLCRIGQ
jgi:hypothetical protein